MSKHLQIMKLALEGEQNVVDARQRARQIAGALGLDNQDQVRVATAVSELARNAYQYASGGLVEFSVALESKPAQLLITVSDRGPGIQDLTHVLSGNYVSKTGMGVGLIGAQRLSDHFTIDSNPNGTRITIAKNIGSLKAVTARTIGDIAEILHRERAVTPFQEIQRQNFELIEALGELRQREQDLTLLNQELNETNRGVVALYAELDEKATSLQRANEVKTNFLSHMTHEFRTPLTSILSLTRLLTERMDGDLSTEQEKQVLYIRKSAEGLLELVGDLLDLAKVEAGRISLKIGDAEAGEILGTLRGVFRPMMPSDSAVELVVESRSEIPTLHTDEGKISQILRNLVSNAMKFTEKGVIAVDAQMTDDDFVMFSVRDTGIGIGAESLERIFEDFSQVESTLQQKARGTGLGLPLSRKLARLLGGDLWVESKAGEGSTFYVKVPRIYKGESAGQLLHRNNHDEPTILMVDDDETSRYVLKNLVKQFVKAKFIECDNPGTAMDLMSRAKPDLVFLDLTMPKLNGFDLLKLIKSNEQLADIPVCINTAKLLTADETDYLQQLSVGILSKERSNMTRAYGELEDVLARVGLVNAKTVPELRT